MDPDDRLAKLSFRSAAEWEGWLRDNHARSEGVWIKIAKKATGIESVRYPEVLESAICFGWIDGQRQALDERRFLQRFTPRRKRSRWSRINRDTADRLITDGRMHPAGLAEVERARADGRWEAAYAGPKASTVPDDLQHELDGRPTAREFFDGLSSQDRYAILYRLDEAKRPETRAAGWQSSSSCSRRANRFTGRHRLVESDPGPVEERGCGRRESRPSWVGVAKCSEAWHRAARQPKAMATPRAGR